VATIRTQKTASVIGQEVFTGGLVQALYPISDTVVLCSSALLLKLPSVSRTQPFIGLQLVYCWRPELLHLLCRFFQFNTSRIAFPLFSGLLKKKRWMGRDLDIGVNGKQIADIKWRNM